MSETAQKTLRGFFSNATIGPQMAAPTAPPVTNVPAAAPVGQSYAQIANTNPTMASRALSALRAGVMTPAGAAVGAGGAGLSALNANYLNRLSDEGLDTMSNAGGGDDTALAAAILREGRNNPTPPALAKPSVATMPTATTTRRDARFPEGSAGVPSAADQMAAMGAGAGAGAGAARTGAGASIGKTQEQPEETTDAMFKRILGATPDPRSNLPREIQEAENLRVGQAGKVLESEKTAATGLAALNDKRGARIAEREQRLADKSSNDVNMALIDAGLAMMQSRGQGLAGIAEGAGVGMKRYTEDLRLTEAARQKIEEARDAFDDLKFNREDMSRKQILAAEGAITDARVATKTANISEISRREGVNLKVAEHIYDAEAAKRLQTQTQKFQAGENVLNRATQIAVANAPNGQMQLALALGNGNAEAGMRKMADIAAGKFNLQESYANYLRSMGPGGMGVSPQEFAAQLRALAPMPTPAASGKPVGKAFE